MRIDRINVFKIVLPFRGDFSLSFKKGSASEILVVEVIGNQGEIRGYGEGIPVKTVTGETPDSTIPAIARILGEYAFPWKTNHVKQIWEFVDTFPKGKSNNTAICSLELALLDALGKHQKRD